MSNTINHISLIMDGNNRWSKLNTVNNKEGYKKGAENLLNLTKYVFKNSEANYVSAFALSKNNLSRSLKIINSIKYVLNYYLDKIEINKINFNIKFIGDLSFLNNDIRRKIYNLNKKNIYKKSLIIFMNYGGLEDIEIAARKFRKNNKKFNTFISTNGIPDPDILIRTGGFQRISNFMLYQLSFTEIYFYKKLWPNFNTSDLKRVIDKYRIVERKFGK